MVLFAELQAAELFAVYFPACVELCETKISNLRVDTHHENKIKQHQIEKSGFEKCGIIYIEDGSPRIAYKKAIDL